MTKQDNSLHIKLTSDNLSIFLSKVKDLVKIDPRLVLKIDKDNILMFSFVGDTFKNIHAFKNYIFKTDELFDIKEKDESNDYSLIFIIKDGKRFNRTLENFIDYGENINCKIVYNEESYVNFMTFDNKKLNIKIIGGDPISIGKEISIDDINYLMDTDNSFFNFNISKNDFEKIKKMSMIDKQLKDVLNIHVKDKKVYVAETKWHLNVFDKIEYENVTITFPKDYFISMNPSSDIQTFVFEGFVLFKYDDYNLMVVLETN